MGKLIFWVVALAVIFGAYRFMQLLERKSANATSQRKNDNDKQIDDGGQLVLACAHCGVYVPAEDAIMLGENAYCSKEHRQLHIQAQQNGSGR